MYISSIFFEFLPLLACLLVAPTAQNCPFRSQKVSNVLKFLSTNFDPLTDCAVLPSRILTFALASSDLIYLFFSFL